MQFIDLKQQFKKIEIDVRQRMDKVLAHGAYIFGPEVAEFEQQAAEYVGVQNCVGVSSGTSALSLAMLALDIGVGDEVITTPFSFFASVECIILRGATPVFVDIDPETYNINPQLIEAAITSKTKAILAVDLYGQCADYESIEKIAKENNLYVIEDGAQSFGASANDRKAGSFGDIGCTSFFPAKPLGCFGDGGACFTNDDSLAQRIRCLANHGQKGRYHHEMIGINGRLDTLQAAVLLSKLAIFDDELAARQQIAAWYKENLPNIQLPIVHANQLSSWAQFIIQVDERSQLQEQLQAKGIPTAVHYPNTLLNIPVVQKHLSAQQQPCPVAQHASQKVMGLPFHPYLSEQEVISVATSVCEIIGCQDLAAEVV